MRKASLLLLAALAAFSALLPAATEYDLGNGKVLVVNDDGTYEYREASLDPSLWTGAQYSFDIKETFRATTRMDVDDSLIQLMFLIPEWRSMMEEMESYSFGFVFISADEVFVSGSSEDEDFGVAVPYSVSLDRRVLLEGYFADISLTFSEDFSRIELRARSGNPDIDRYTLILTRVE